jgi:putative ABC transport system permease protein
MRLSDTLSMATTALVGSPVRSLLTLLGIIIGVGCVVSMAAIGAGAQQRVADQIRAFGANVLLINPGATNKDGVSGATGSRKSLTIGDAEAIAALPTVENAAPSDFGTVQVVAKNRNWSTTVNGTTSRHFVIREWGVASGRLFSPYEESSASKVAIIGATAAERLFGSGDPIGQIVRILNTPFTIIGVLKSKGMSPGGQDQDDVVFVPLKAAMVRLIGGANSVNHDAIAYILTSARSSDWITAAAEDIKDLLRQRHERQGRDDDFTVTTAAAALAAQQSSTRTIALLLGSVAAISLIVGGISIMNIMLVCVTERTSEIGLRLAIGARPRDIQRQFLLEAVALCSVGGVVGVILGSVAALSVTRVFGWPILIQPARVAAAVALAAAFGITFGWYPARRAATLQPVDALRRA